MQLLEVSGAVRPIYGSLGVKRLMEVLWYELHWGIIWCVVLSIRLFSCLKFCKLPKSGDYKIYLQLQDA